MSRGLVTAVSAEDYAVALQHSWQPLINRGRLDGAETNTKDTRKGRRTYLSRMIAERIYGYIPRRAQIDHWNRFTLDNRRENLRICTAQDNTRNRPKSNNSLAPFIGVQQTSNFTGKRGGKQFCARVHFRGRNRYLGSYTTAKEAALVRDDFCRKHFGKFFEPNFPKLDERPPVAPKIIRQQVPSLPRNRYAWKQRLGRFVGVHRRTPHTWRWALEIRGRRIRVGRFSTAVEAAISRDEYIKENGLPHELNFEEERSESAIDAAEPALPDS